MAIRTLLYCAILALAAAGHAAPALDLTVPLPPGETPLADIGIYRVAYQSYGKDTVEMPVSWMGHFTTESGISYVPHDRMLGRTAILLHSPWRVPPGKVWVEYRLALPRATPIALSFGIAMAPDVAAPGKSDGVTFSCFVRDGAEERELLRQHQEKAQWRDYHFDLSAYAGRTITLRLQTEPGPANSPSFDYSYFGDAKVLVGKGSASQAGLVQQLTGTRAYLATAKADLRPLSNDARNGVLPGNLIPCKNSIARAGTAYRFTYAGADGRVVYTYTPATGTLDDFSVQMDDGRPFAPAQGGGATLVIPKAEGTETAPARGGKPLRIALSKGGGALDVLWEYPTPAGPARIAWTFRIVGKALAVSARSAPSQPAGQPARPSAQPAQPANRTGQTGRTSPTGAAPTPTAGAAAPAQPAGTAGQAPVAAGAGATQPAGATPRSKIGNPKSEISAFSLGEVGRAPLRKTFGVPYLAGYVAYLPAQNLFVCRYLDWTVSHASRCPQGLAVYEAKTDGSRNSLLESGYIAVSPHVGEVLPNIPNPPSPYLALLGPKVMLDVWKHHRGTYQGDGENLRALKDSGVDHVAIINHSWQCFGYDVKLPDHIPANPGPGGDAGMVLFGKAANDCGYVWSLHENYIDLYPDAPSYDATARVLRADGSPSPAWFNRGTGVQSYGLKCNRALEFARKNAPEIHRRYGTNAAYLDVHTCVPPWHQLDYEAGQPMAGMALGKVKFDTELFQFMRDTHRGPLFGEGHNHFYWAGRCDGAEAQVAGGEHHLPFLDFDLLKIHPQMVNHGMGYYERWFKSGYDHRWGHDTGTPEQVDKYRAQELAYGHAGFIGSEQTDNVQWVAKEHHLMHAVQRLYGTARPTEIAYEVAGRFVPAGVALVAGERGRQRIRYDSGLTLWVNWLPEPWKVEGRILPQWGFLALGPGTEVCTVLRDGKLADMADCPDYLFVDARTSFEMPYLKPGKEIEPRLREFKHLGENRVRLTYEWVVNDTLADDYHCFVHFTNEASKGPDKIEFQQDHGLPKPTSQWRKGETIVDGPYEIAIPAGRDTYDLTIGLHKGARVPLKGIQAGGSRILLGRLVVKRAGDKVTEIALGDIGEAAREQEVGRADFGAHLNPAGTWVEFGKVGTDGSAKINKEKGRLVIFPYPRGKEFRLSLSLKALAPAADPARVQVRAVAAGTGQDLGKAVFTVAAGRLTLTTGTPGAGRYVVTW